MGQGVGEVGEILQKMLKERKEVRLDKNSVLKNTQIQQISLKQT